MNPPIIYFAISLSLGIAASYYINIPITFLFIIGLVLVSASFLFLKHRVYSHIAIYLAIFFLGMVCYEASNILPMDHISRITPQGGERVFLKGAIIDDPVLSATSYGAEKASYILNIDSLKKTGPWQKASGLVKVDVYSRQARRHFYYGQEVILEGDISKAHGLKNPGLFDYARYLAANNIYSMLKVGDRYIVKDMGHSRADLLRNMAYALRHKIKVRIDRYFDRASADNGFLSAIIVGDRSNLKKSINEDFIKTGTVHILSISGSHVGLVACILIFIFASARIPRKINLALTMPCLLFYSFVVGLCPPIVRSTMMYCIFALGCIMDREGDLLNSLALSAFIMLLYNPKQLFDPSFQLSFGSLAGIFILTKKMDGLFAFGPSTAPKPWAKGAAQGQPRASYGLQAGARRGVDKHKKSSVPDKIRFFVLEGISISVAAWIGVGPIVSFYFNIASPISIIANLIIVPAALLAMVASFIFLLVSAFAGFLAGYFAISIHVLDQLIFRVNHILSLLPFSYFRTPAPSPVFFAVYYVVISAWIFWPKMKDSFKRGMLIAALIMANIFVWMPNFKKPESTVNLTFLDVGQGDSTYIELPETGNILIDGGSGQDEERFDTGKSVIAPYLWNRHINKVDAVIVTHFHEDHLGGIIYILNNFKVGCVIDNGAIPKLDNRIYAIYRKIINEKNIRHIVVRQGDVITLHREAQLFILNPARDMELEDSNENSLLIKLVYKNSGVLLCGDINDNAMDRLIKYRDFLRSDIIKVPHHGGHLGTRDVVNNFFEAVLPKVSVISVGAANRFGMPSQETLGLINDTGSNIYQTKDAGAVTVSLKENAFTVNTVCGRN